MGSGKSVQASRIIDALKEHCDRDQGGPWGLAYFYFDFNDIEYQDPLKMVKSTMLHLGIRNRETERCLNEELREFYDARQAVTTKLVCEILQKMVEKFKATYIILDALDECAELEWPNLLRVIDGILGCATTKLLITSRNETQIEEYVRSVDPDKRRIIRLQGDGVSDDMRAYIRSRWERDLGPWARLKTPERRLEIEEELISKSEGM